MTALRRTAIIGGETHLREVSSLDGSLLKIVATSMKEEVRKQQLPELAVPNYADADTLLQAEQPELVAIANENDLKASAVLKCLRAGADVIVDKPFALTLGEQAEIEQCLLEMPRRKLLVLLTLRGEPGYAGLRQAISSGDIGIPVMSHIRMAVRLKRALRPDWFLDSRRSGGLFLDLLVHGIDYLEWATGAAIAAMTAVTGNIGNRDDPHVRDHAAVFCEMTGGASALIEGQRMLPDTKGEDYRLFVAGTEGTLEFDWAGNRLICTNKHEANKLIPLAARRSIVADWLEGGSLADQASSLRSNRLAVLATLAADQRQRITV